MLPRLYIIIPCYNEEEVLPITSQLFREELEKLMEHFTNYGEVLSKTVAAYEKKAKRRDNQHKNHKKPIVPLYKRRSENAGIHKSVV